MDKVTKEVMKNHLFQLKSSIQLATVGNVDRQRTIEKLHEEIADANIRVAKYNQEIGIIENDLKRAI